LYAAVRGYDAPVSFFAGTGLATRIERAESRLCSEGTSRAIRRGVREGFARPLAGGVAVFAGAGSPFVKVAGLGFAGPLDERELEAVEQEFARRGAPVRVELSNLGEPSIAPLLTHRGYVLQGFENVLGRPLPPPVATTPSAVEVSEGTEGDDPLWLATIVEGFAHADPQGVPSDESFPREAVEAAMSDMAGVTGYERYLARVGGVVAGAASMVRLDGVAILCGAATLPAHRRRGVQTALLAARLERAARDGCDVAVITTQPGSKSQENAQRQGFSLLYTRAVLVREP
jgi:GNAT superfamily N-acetyltransferase